MRHIDYDNVSGSCLATSPPCFRNRMTNPHNNDAFMCLSILVWKVTGFFGIEFLHVCFWKVEEAWREEAKCMTLLNHYQISCDYCGDIHTTLRVLDAKGNMLCLLCLILKILKKIFCSYRRLVLVRNFLKCENIHNVYVATSPSSLISLLLHICKC